MPPPHAVDLPDTRVTRFYTRLGAHPWFTLACVLALILLAGAGLPRLQFTTDYRAFFDADNPELAAFEALEQTYTKNDNVLFLIAPRDGRVFTREMLATLEWLTAEAWKLPYTIRVDSVTNFQHTRAAGDELVVRDLVRDAASLTEAQLADLRAIATAEPLLVHRLIAPAADVTAVNVTVHLPGVDQITEVPEVVEATHALTARLIERAPDLEVHLTGMVMFNRAFSEASQADMARLLPIAFLVIVVASGLMLRHWTGTFITFLVIALTVVATMGIGGWLGIRLTPPSASTPLIVMTLAVADSVHLLSTFFHHYRAGLDKRTALAESMRLNMQAVFLTSFTTVLGNISMNFSEVPPFRDLGNLVSIGVTIAWLLSVTLLPALVTLLPLHRPPRDSHASQAMHRLADFNIRRRGAVLAVCLGITVVLGAFVPRNELNDVYVRYFDETLPIRQANDFAEQRLSGLYVAHYSLDSGAAGAISEPAFLGELDAFAEWLRTQPEVVHVLSLADTMRRLNRNLHGDDPAFDRIPEDRELAAQYLLLYEMSLPYGLDLNDQINVDKSATRLAVTLHTQSVQGMLAFDARVREWLSAHAPHLDAGAGATGTPMMFTHIGERNIRGLVFGNIASLVLISFTLIFAFRSWRIGLLSLIPNLIPAAMAFGVWGMVSGQVGLGLSVVVGMTLGIVVDDTIHFLSKYLKARRERGLTEEQAVRYAFRTVGDALWITSAVLVAGFMVLATSNFRLNSEMALMTSLTIAIAIFMDFFLLPALLLRGGKRPTSPP